MAEVTPSRETVYTQEISYKKAVTENTWTKFGGAINFVNQRHHERKTWILNGNYTAVAVTGLDGLWVVPFDLAILYFAMGNVTAGTSGTTEADILRFTTPGGAGSSIFSTTPKMTSAASSNSYMLKDVLVPANDVSPVGATLPVFSVTQLDQGDALRFDLLQSMVDAANVTVELHYRPR